MDHFLVELFAKGFAWVGADRANRLCGGNMCKAVKSCQIFAGWGGI